MVKSFNGDSGSAKVGYIWPTWLLLGRLLFKLMFNLLSCWIFKPLFVPPDGSSEIRWRPSDHMGIYWLIALKTKKLDVYIFLVDFQSHSVAAKEHWQGKISAHDYSMYKFEYTDLINFTTVGGILNKNTKYEANF